MMLMYLLKFTWLQTVVHITAVVDDGGGYTPPSDCLCSAHMDHTCFTPNTPDYGYSTDTKIEKCQKTKNIACEWWNMNERFNETIHTRMLLLLFYILERVWVIYTQYISIVNYNTCENTRADVMSVIHVKYLVF